VSPEFRRLAALASSSQRLLVAYLPRSSELLCSVARTGFGRRDLDLHLALVPDTAPESALKLVSGWLEGYLFGYPESAADIKRRVLGLEL